MNGVMQLGRDQGIGAVVWSPLGWGKLTGKIRRGQPAKPGTRASDIAGTGPRYDDERLFRIIDALDLLVEETGKSLTQIALNWLLQRPTVSTIIIGARNEEQLLQNLGASGWSLTRADRRAGRGQRSDARLSGLAPAWNARTERTPLGVAPPGRRRPAQGGCQSSNASHVAAADQKGAATRTRGDMSTSERPADTSATKRW